MDFSVRVQVNVYRNEMFFSGSFFSADHQHQAIVYVLIKKFHRLKYQVIDRLNKIVHVARSFGDLPRLCEKLFPWNAEGVGNIEKMFAVNEIFAYLLERVSVRGE